MFRDVPACSGMLRVPAFIDAQLKNSQSLCAFIFQKCFPRVLLTAEDRRAPTLWHYIQSVDR